MQLGPVELLVVPGATEVVGNRKIHNLRATIRVGVLARCPLQANAAQGNELSSKLSSELRVAIIDKSVRQFVRMEHMVEKLAGDILG